MSIGKYEFEELKAMAFRDIKKLYSIYDKRLLRLRKYPEDFRLKFISETGGWYASFKAWGCRYGQYYRPGKLEGMCNSIRQNNEKQIDVKLCMD